MVPPYTINRPEESTNDIRDQDIQRDFARNTTIKPQASKRTIMTIDKAGNRWIFLFFLVYVLLTSMVIPLGRCCLDPPLPLFVDLEEEVVAV